MGQPQQHTTFDHQPNKVDILLMSDDAMRAETLRQLIAIRQELKQANAEITGLRAQVTEMQVQVDEQVIQLPEIAKQLGVSPKTARSLLRSGEISPTNLNPMCAKRSAIKAYQRRLTENKTTVQLHPILGKMAV